MPETQIMKTIEKEFIFEATADSKEAFFGAVFARLKKQVYQEVQGVVIHMEPLGVYLLEEREETYTEKFLWLLMPRTKTRYVAKVKLVVTIKYI